jgi:hypothetical protein
MNVFELKDSVKWTKQPEAWVVEQISDTDEPRYYRELNRDSATQAVGTSEDLELVAKAQKAEVSLGFVPDKPLF